MQLPPTIASVTVLCVGDGDPGIRADLEARIHAVGGVVAYCGDIYRATIKVAREVPAVLIVSVDEMTQEETEFFWIMRRRNKQLPILVTGSSTSASRMEQAIEAGATAEYSIQALESYIGFPTADPPSSQSLAGDEAGGDRRVVESSPAPQTVVAAEAEAAGEADQVELDRALCQELADAWGTDRFANRESSSPDKTGRVEPDNGAVDSKCTEVRPSCSDNERDCQATTDNGKSDQDRVSNNSQSEDAKAECKAGQTLKGKARVPWLRYGDGPQRKGPPRSTTPPAEPTEEGATEAPLLSPEELEALLGDDGETGKT